MLKENNSYSNSTFFSTVTTSCILNYLQFECNRDDDF